MEVSVKIKLFIKKILIRVLLLNVFSLFIKIFIKKIKLFNKKIKLFTLMLLKRMKNLKIKLCKMFLVKINF